MEQEKINENLERLNALNYSCNCTFIAEAYADISTLASNTLHSGLFAYRAIYYCIEGAYHLYLHRMYKHCDNMLEFAIALFESRKFKDKVIVSQEKKDFLIKLIDDMASDSKLSKNTNLVIKEVVENFHIIPQENLPIDYNDEECTII